MFVQALQYVTPTPTPTSLLHYKNFRGHGLRKDTSIYHNLALGVYLLIEEGEGEDVGEPVP